MNLTDKWSVDIGGIMRLTYHGKILFLINSVITSVFCLFPNYSSSLNFGTDMKQYVRSSCECNKVVSAFLLFCRRGDFVFQTVFLDCWKFKRKEKLNRIKNLLFLYDINDLLF